MEPENKQHYQSLQDQLNAQQQALTQIYKSVEKTRKYIFWTGVVNFVLFILPLVATIIFLPRIMNMVNGAFGAFSGNGDGSSIEVLSEPGLRESLENLQELGIF
ncbi:MAG: hypothetical protein MRY57_03020 [Candidatus Pacebacteria bacterium]|nr:hypothetical protein [Candidatus Paceibacterota bacterium]